MKKQLFGLFKIYLSFGGVERDDFSLEESAGISSVVFSGFAASVTSDINTGTVPVGGTLVSVGSSDGYGYVVGTGASVTAVELTTAGTNYIVDSDVDTYNIVGSGSDLKLNITIFW